MRFSLFLVVLLPSLPAGQVLAEEPCGRGGVAEPYIELHTGPGRGYPVFHVVDRGETITVLKRRTDWFRVRTAKGKEGWVKRAAMELTLTPAVIRPALPMRISVIFPDGAGKPVSWPVTLRVRM